MSGRPIKRTLRALGLCQVGVARTGIASDEAATQTFGLGTGHLTPHPEGTCAQEAMVDGSQHVAAGAKEILHESVHRSEVVRVADRLEPAHLPFTLPRRLMRDLRPIVLVQPRAVWDGRHHGALRRRVAPQLVCDQPARQPVLSLQHLAEESYGRSPIASRSDEDVEEVAVLVDGPPEISALPLNRCEDFVQIPGVTQTATAAP